MVVQVGQLGGDQGAFLQLDQRHCVGCVLLEAGRGLVNRREGIDLTAPAELEGFTGFLTAIRADVTGREDLHLAVRADLAHQGVALFL